MELKQKTQVLTFGTTVSVSASIAVSVVALFSIAGILASIPVINSYKSTSSYPTEKNVAVDFIKCPKVPLPTLDELLKNKKTGGTIGKVQAQQAKQGVKQLLPLEAQDNKTSTQYYSLLQSGQGLQALKTYGQNMAILAREKPKDAWDITASQDLLFLHSYTDCTEKPVSGLEGSAFVIVATSENNEHDRFVHEESVYEIRLRADGGEEYFLYMSEAGEFIESRTRLRIDEGVLFNGNEIVVKEYSIISQPGNPPVLGDQSALVIKVHPNPNNDTFHYNPVLVPDDIIAPILFDEIDDFYTENSYGQMRIVGVDGQYPGDEQSLFPDEGSYEITLPYVCSSNRQRVCDPSLQTDECFARGEGSCQLHCGFDAITNQSILQSDTDVQFSAGQRVVVLSDRSVTCQQWGIIGMENVLTNEGEVPLSFTFVTSPYKHVMAHEIGHNFGLQHAARRNCTVGMNSIEECDFVYEYGNIFDIMGIAQLYSPLHIGARGKELLGWLTPDGNNQIIEITPQLSGQQIDLLPISNQAPGIKGIKFRRSGPGEPLEYVYLEWHSPVGLEAEAVNVYADENIETNIFEGVLVRSGPDMDDNIYVTDSMINPTFSDSRFLYPVSFNSSFVLPDTGAEIIVGNEVDGTVGVTVNHGRTDFTPPYVEIREISDPESCIGQFEIIGNDNETGINRVEIFSNTHGRLDNLTTLLTIPYILEINFGVATYVDIRAVAYDNASNNGIFGSKADNASTFVYSLDSRHDRIEGCKVDSSLNALEVFFPEFGYQYSQSPMDEVTNVSAMVYPNFELQYEFMLSEPLPSLLFTLNGEYYYRGGWECGPAGGACLIKTQLFFEPISEHVNTINVNLHDLYLFDFDRRYRLAFNLNTLAGNEVIPPMYIELNLLDRTFIRGDVDQDGRYGISDPIAILASLFTDNDSIHCQDAADVNDDGRVNMTDAINMLEWLFQGTSNPPRDHSQCSIDWTRDGLTCERYNNRACPFEGEGGGAQAEILSNSVDKSLDKESCVVLQKYNLLHFVDGKCNLFLKESTK